MMQDPTRNTKFWQFPSRMKGAAVIMPQNVGGDEVIAAKAVISEGSGSVRWVHSRETRLIHECTVTLLFP